MEAHTHSHIEYIKFANDVAICTRTKSNCALLIIHVCVCVYARGMHIIAESEREKYRSGEQKIGAR